MAGNLRGNVDLKIGETKYTLCYDHSALIELEEQLDRGILAITNELQSWSKDPERMRLKWIRAMLFVGLKKHHPRLTLEDVNDIMSVGDTSIVWTAVGDAMAASFGSSSTPENDAARPTNGDAQTGTGKVS